MQQNPQNLSCESDPGDFHLGFRPIPNAILQKAKVNYLRGFSNPLLDGYYFDRFLLTLYQVEQICVFKVHSSRFLDEDELFIKLVLFQELSVINELRC